LAGAISPGELVTIFGANLGLSSNASGSVAGNFLGTGVDNTQVFFGGIPSPLLLVSSTQINAVVPFGVTGTTTQLQVLYRSRPTASFTVPVQSASPAVFSLDGSGGGQGAILNQDGSVNSQGNPASPGSVVVLFVNGMGLTTPASTDGMLTYAPYPTPVLPVSVTIGGQSTQLLYAGAAPGLVAGVVQINLIVPANAPLSPYDQVVVTVGDDVSPATVTMAVK
jgi:uncharacterized protein (TIGR03437 family)